MGNGDVQIESIRLKNFMTFKDALVRLTPGLTIIVGPNGAGKSAIFHAIKFCLGSNQRENRYDRWSQFIRNHTGSAEIEITVRDHRTTRVFTRKIEMGRTPRAYIDGKRVRAAEMRRAIEDLHFNIDNPLVFMAQGRTNDLRDASPEQVLRLIEEGTGLDRSRDKIILQESELSADRQRLEEAIAETKAVESDIHLLTKDMQRLEKKREYERQRRALEREYAWATLQDVEMRIESIKKQIEAQKEGMNELRDDKAKVSKEIEAVEEKRTRLEREQRSIERELGRLESRIKSKQEQLERIEKGNAKTLSEIKKLEETIEADKIQLRRIGDDLKRVVKAHGKAEIESQQLAQERDKIVRELEELETQLAKFEKWDRKRREAQTEVSGFALQLKDKRIELRAFLTKQQHLEAEIEAMENKWGQAWSTLETSSAEDLDRQLKELDARLATLNESLFGEKSQLAELQKEIKSLELKLSETAERIPPSVQELQKLLHEHQLGGVVGPVGGLLVGNEELAAPAEAVLSDILVHAFITTEKADFQLTRRLRDEIEAPAPIILVDLQQEVAPAPELPPNSRVRGWLWELLGLTDTLLQKFRIAFGDYAVTTDSKTAARLAYKGISAVTLKGEVFESRKKTVVGHPKKGPPKILSTAPFLKKQKEAKKRAQQVEKKIAEINAEITVVSEKRTKILELVSQMGAWKTTWKRRKEITEELPQVKENITQLEEEIAQLTSHHERAKVHVAELEQHQPPERERITGEMEAIRIRLRNIESDLGDAKARVAISEQSMKNFREQLDSIRENIEMMETSRNELLESLGQSEDESSEILQDIANLDKQMKEHQKQKQALSEQLDQIHADQRQLNTRLAEIDMELRTSRTEVSKTLATLSRLELRRNEILVSVEGVPQPNTIRNHEVVYAELSRVRDVLTDYTDVDESIAVRDQQLKERMEVLNAQVATLKEELAEAISTIDSLKDQYQKDMAKTLRKVEKYVNRLLRKIDFTGEIRLEHIQQDDSAGIHFQIRTHAEEFLGIKAGSGGEQSMLIVALILALHKFNPAPIYVLDEVDTFLDLENTNAAAQLLREASKESQLLVFTPAKSTTLLKYADRLIGVAAPSGNSPARIIEGPILSELEKDDEAEEKPDDPMSKVAN
ncbi:MAG: chromosome segregation protein SMC [Candidatus Thorarchaeota archaeon]|nr:chromosome segregation protein SMC [Candidatus Thorarchaeota archaeon]